MKLRRVRKRDGREVPFDKQKIAHAVERAQASVGEDDAPFALEVADIVDMTLARRFASERAGEPSAPELLPGIEEIQDLVERALIELGHASVAKSYILYRDRRARIRSALEVRRETVLGSESGSAHEARTRALRGPRVQVSGGLESWRKSRIVAALMDEADLPRASAEEVATRVEERVFDSGLKRISTALIRELVDNELVDMGLSQALRRQRPVGVPRHDLRRILSTADQDRATHERGGGEPLGARDVEGQIAGDILRRYALEDILPEHLAEMHLAGEFQVEDLSRPHLPLVTAVPCDLLLSGEPVARSAFGMLGEIGALARASSYGVVLEDCAALFLSLARPARGALSPTAARNGNVSGFLCALAALSSALDRRIDLVFATAGARAHAPAGTLQPPPTWLARLVGELGQLEGDPSNLALVHVFLDAGEIGRLAIPGTPLARALDVLLARGRIVPTWSGESERCAGPGLVRVQRERGAIRLGAAVALNLPRAARRAGPWREDALLENLSSLVEHALDALLAVRELQREGRAGDARPRSRTAYALSAVGLREALRWLGDGELRPEQASRVVAFLVEAAARLGAERGLSVLLTPWFGERAALRFAELDAALFQVEQPLLFETSIDPSRRARGVAYSVGFDLSPENPGLASAGSRQGAGEAAALAALKCGALHPPSLLRAQSLAPGLTEPRHLAALERLDRARSRLRAGAHALYALPAIQLEDSAGSAGQGSVRASPDPDASGELYPEPEIQATVSAASPRRARGEDS